MTMTEPDEAPLQAPLPMDVPDQPPPKLDFRQDPEARELIERTYESVSKNLMSVADLSPDTPENAELIKWAGKGRQCRAWSKNKKRQCGRAANPGMLVCNYHGGAAPQVQRKATERLQSLTEPAVAALAKELVNPQATPGDRIKAADSILDRTGHGRGMSINGEEAVTSLASRLYAEAQARNLIPARDSEDIVIISEDDDDHGVEA